MPWIRFGDSPYLVFRCQMCGRYTYEGGRFAEGSCCQANVRAENEAVRRGKRPLRLPVWDRPAKIWA